MIRRLTDADLWSVDACPVCDSTAPRSVIASANADPVVDWLACSVCRGTSMSRMPSDAYLDHFYAGYYSSLRRSSRIDNAMWSNIARRLLKEIRSRNTETDAFRILDFGGG